MSEKSIEAFLNEHIPYRMSIIDAFCMTMMQHISPAEVNGRRIGFASNEVRFETFSGSRFVPMSEFSNLTIEAGLISCRVLMEFLGLAHDRYKPGQVREVDSKNDDDFAFKRLFNDYPNMIRLNAQRVNDFMDGSLMIGESDSVSLCGLGALLKHANKASGHLTVGPKPAYSAVEYIGAQAILVFVEDLLYGQIDKPRPQYSSWTWRLLDETVQSTQESIRAKVRQEVRSRVYPELLCRTT
jgi:hypothetical protein